MMVTGEAKMRGKTSEAIAEEILTEVAAPVEEAKGHVD